ncbi:MAG TPA: hypothetical protein VJX16_01215 [Terriglobales bacterium]|nr:hypothetical protein [Terriglobales bacterium]
MQFGWNASSYLKQGDFTRARRGAVFLAIMLAEISVLSAGGDLKVGAGERRLFEVP